MTSREGKIMRSGFQQRINHVERKRASALDALYCVEFEENEINLTLEQIMIYIEYLNGFMEYVEKNKISDLFHVIKDRIENHSNIINEWEDIKEELREFKKLIREKGNRNNSHSYEYELNKFVNLEKNFVKHFGEESEESINTAIENESETSTNSNLVNNIQLKRVTENWECPRKTLTPISWETPVHINTSLEEDRREIRSLTAKLNELNLKYKEMEERLQYTPTVHQNERHNDNYAFNHRNPLQREYNMDMKIFSKTPKVELKPFEGNTKNYKEFMNLFNLMINSNKRMSATEKFYHLKASLTGSASDLISFLPITEYNYDKALRILEQTFDKPEEVKRELKSELTNIRNDQDNPHYARKAFYRIKAIVSALEEHECVDNDELITKISEKFDIQINREIAKMRLILKRRLSIQEVLDIIEMGIETEIKAREQNCHKRSEKNSSMNFLIKRSGETRQRMNFNERKNDYNYRSQDRKDNAHNYIRYTNTIEKCVFCNYSNHNSIDCRKVHDIKSRRDILISDKRCWICFSKEHSSFNCGKEKCNKCQRNHHVSVCLYDKEKHDISKNSSEKNHNLTGANAEPLNQNFRFTPLTIPKG